jgi:NAD(P)-dependent dehydrogenase (short-subunit alcohol dehydrogenase family)
MVMSFEAAAAFGRVDVLFNNAGSFGPSGSVDQISLGDWNETIAVNLTGTMLCAAAGGPANEGTGPPRRPDHQ